MYLPYLLQPFYPARASALRTRLSAARRTAADPCDSTAAQFRHNALSRLGTTHQSLPIEVPTAEPIKGVFTHGLYWYLPFPLYLGTFKEGKLKPICGVYMPLVIYGQVSKICVGTADTFAGRFQGPRMMLHSERLNSLTCRERLLLLVGSLMIGESAESRCIYD